ncbi:hypothetical protein BC830DRAFT_1167966 [Chytriomyces sp. MP71]|nr:hypothetical protein BC830DRAFT_1167966 [Chytriomyces sp. MP71]
MSAIVVALLPSIVLGQARKRLLAALPETEAYNLLASAVAGGIQAGVALSLKVPSALEKAPEHRELVARAERRFWPTLLVAVLRKSAGFAVFFWVYDTLKVKLKNVKLSAKAAQNLLAASLAATFYRITTWILDGHLPRLPDNEKTDEDRVLGGMNGGNPYSAALEQIKGSILKAAISLVAMDLALGRPSW